jgi:hypothetical protein
MVKSKVFTELVHAIKYQKMIKKYDKMDACISYLSQAAMPDLIMPFKYCFLWTCLFSLLIITLAWLAGSGGLC